MRNGYKNKEWIKKEALCPLFFRKGIFVMKNIDRVCKVCKNSPVYARGLCRSDYMKNYRKLKKDEIDELRRKLEEIEKDE